MAGSSSSWTQKYFGRVGRIEIEGFDATKINNGLDFKFNVTKVGDVYAQFSCSVLGLSASSINELTVWNPQTALKLSRKIQIYAGYEQSGARRICKGFVFNALPTPPPEMWMNFDCMLSIDKKEPVEFMQSDLTAKEMADKVAAAVGMKKVQWKATTVDLSTKASMYCNVSKDQLCQEFANTFNVKVLRTDDDALLVTDVNGENTTSPTKDATKICLETGLLSVGSVTAGGATVRVRLNDDFKLHEWVYLESTLMPKASGNYYVIEKKHVGHLRGEDWYTELTMVRKG